MRTAVRPLPPRAEGTVLEVTAETVGRDQGHPSVIIWDLANEAQWGWGFDAQLALVRQMDSSRPTLFSFDLNQLGDDNPLPRKPQADRPDIRTGDPTGSADAGAHERAAGPSHRL